MTLVSNSNYSTDNATQVQISNKHVLESYTRLAAAEPGKYGVTRRNAIQKEG